MYVGYVTTISVKLKNDRHKRMPQTSGIPREDEQSNNQPHLFDGESIQGH